MRIKTSIFIFVFIVALSFKTLAQTHRNAGRKIDVTVYANEESYASFPKIIRTEKELVLTFQEQKLQELQKSASHPHHQKVSKLKWAISKDGGLTWIVTSEPPRIGKVLDISYGSAPLKDGGVVHLTFDADKEFYSLIQRGYIGYGGYMRRLLPNTQKYRIQDYGPFGNPYPHGFARLSNGSIIAGCYALIEDKELGLKKYITFFLASSDEGKSWKYLSAINDDNAFGFAEPVVIELGKGRLLSILRATLDHLPKDKMPVDAPKEGYGYWIYQSESTDYGKTWSKPEKLPLWGHPAEIRQLKSGNLLMVYGHRRPPYSIKAVLSRDKGASWDLETLKTIYTFDPGGTDIGYPVITQLKDGSIVCAYYGYASKEIHKYSPRGIFVSIFDEKWLESADDTSLDSR